MRCTYATAQPNEYSIGVIKGGGAWRRNRHNLNEGLILKLVRQRTFARVGQMTINRWFQNSHFHLD